jgi:hypothetical protein
MIAGSVLFFTIPEYEVTSLLVESVSEGFDNVALANFEKPSLRAPNTSFKFPRILLHFSCRRPLSTVLHDSKSAGNVKFPA